MIDDDDSRCSGVSHKNLCAVFPCIVYFCLRIRDILIEMKYSADHFVGLSRKKNCDPNGREQYASHRLNVL